MRMTLRVCTGLFLVVALTGCVAVTSRDAYSTQTPGTDAASVTPGADPTETALTTPTLPTTPSPEPTPEVTPVPTEEAVTPEPAVEAPVEPSADPTPLPDLSQARLAGSWDVTIEVVKKPKGADLKKGETWTDTWDITPECSAGACRVVVDAGMGPSGYSYHSFTVDLARNGAVYTGSTKEKLTTCGGEPPIGVWVKNKITLRIEVTKAASQDDAWVATQWTGTMVLHSPYTKTPMLTYCPAQSWKMSLTAAD